MWQRIRCAIGLHQWSRWTEPEQYWITRVSGLSGAELGKVARMAQTRTCEACGKFSWRTV